VGRHLNRLAPPNFTAARGTPLWEYNHFRVVVLTSLLNDLIDLENVGVQEHLCSLVRQALGHFVNSTTCIPSGGFLTGALLTEAQKFEELYKDWNGVAGTGDDAKRERRKFLKDLRKSRQKITNKVRNLQIEFFTNMDTVILRATYQAVFDIITTAPKLFRNLAEAHSRYEEGKAGHPGGGH
jgi:hypothetical protein